MCEFEVIMKIILKLLLENSKSHVGWIKNYGAFNI